MRGTLKGEEELRLDDLGRAFVETVRVTGAPRRVDVTVAVEIGESHSSLELRDLDQVPSSDNLDPQVVDYESFFWRAGKVLFVVGDSRAIALGLRSGSAIAEVPMGYIYEVSSMDFTQCKCSEDERLVAVGSPLSVHVFASDEAGNVALFRSLQFDKAIKALHSVDQAGVVIEEYIPPSQDDGQVQLRRIEFASG